MSDKELEPVKMQYEYVPADQPPLFETKLVALIVSPDDIFVDLMSVDRMEIVVIKRNDVGHPGRQEKVLALSPDAAKVLIEKLTEVTQDEDQTPQG